MKNFKSAFVLVGHTFTQEKANKYVSDGSVLKDSDNIVDYPKMPRAKP